MALRWRDYSRPTLDFMRWLLKTASFLQKRPPPPPTTRQLAYWYHEARPCKQLLRDVRVPSGLLRRRFARLLKREAVVYLSLDNATRLASHLRAPFITGEKGRLVDAVEAGRAFRPRALLSSVPLVRGQ